MDEDIYCKCDEWVEDDYFINGMRLLHIPFCPIHDASEEEQEFYRNLEHKDYER